METKVMITDNVNNNRLETQDIAGYRVVDGFIYLGRAVLTKETVNRKTDVGYRWVKQLCPTLLKNKETLILQ